MDYNNRKKSILVMDSGNGGKYTLGLLTKKLPNENFIYFEDDHNAPYGNKSKHKLKSILKHNLDFLFKNFEIKMVIFACNTLSATCYDYARKKYKDIPFIPIFPYIKKQKKPLLILCTKATVKNYKPIKKLKKIDGYYILSFSNFSKKIDENINNLCVFQGFFDKKLKKYAKMHICNVSLGCTHYNLIKTQIENALTNNPYVENYKKLYKTKKGIITIKRINSCINFFESSVELTNKTCDILKVLSLKNLCHKKGKTIFIKSSNKYRFIHF